MKVLANDGISKSGIELLEKNGFEVELTKVAQEQLPKYINKNNVTVLLVRSATQVRKDIIDGCNGLKIIGRGGVGMDNIDVDYAKSKGNFTIGITGNYKNGEGGLLAKRANLVLVFDTQSMEVIEDLHLVVNHVIKENIKLRLKEK